MSSINALGMFEYFVGHGIGEASNFDVARVIVYHQQVVLLLPLKQVTVQTLCQGSYGGSVCISGW
jgi:hypothetical protein